MAKYINADKLTAAISEQKLMAREPAVKKILQMIEDAPAADVEPVRHAKFVHFSDVWGTCSNCGEILFDEERKFCPNCGAKMDASGGEQNEPSENK